MDAIVLAAMKKWPNVPHCHGWLRLDALGRWRMARFEGDFPGDVVRHPGLADFIARNYQPNERGEWYFQNGPQRVYVSLEYTPQVLRLAEGSGLALVTHGGLKVERDWQTESPQAGGWLDEDGHVLIDTEHGVGVIDARDLTAFVGRAEAAGLIEQLQPIARAEVPARFGFVAVAGKAAAG
ncbi:MAG TPA: DUF2946 family protein [Burkholderiaceae bacterium]|nr:DUF2946 family protein [Burkholderiaceae bacterium]